MYYRLESDDLTMSAYIEPIYEISRSLISGKLIDLESTKLPCTYSVRQEDSAQPLFDYYSAPCLMSKRLVHALEGAGVSSLQKIEAELVDDDTKVRRTDFWVVNVVGLVQCASVDDSVVSELGSSYYFHELAVDTERASGLLMFRLAESLMDVIVHEKIAETIERGKFEGLVLRPLKE